MKQELRVEYTFTKQEALVVAYATRRLRPYKRRSIFQTIMAVIALALFGALAIANPGDIFAWFIAALSIALLFSCWHFPKKAEEIYLNNNDILEPRVLQVDSRFINLDRAGGMISVRPIDVVKAVTVDDILIMHHRHGGSIEVPLRALTDQQIKQLDDILATGQQDQA